MAVLTREAASARGDELALADDDDTRTWAQLDIRVNRLVHALRDAGLGPGDTISVVAGNRNEWFEVALACSHAGVVFVPVSWHLVAPEMAYIIEDSGSRAVLVGHRFTDVAAEALADPRSSAVELAVAIGAPDDSRFADFEAFLGSGSDAEPVDRCSTPRARPGIPRVSGAVCPPPNPARRPKCGNSSPPASPIS